MVAKSSIARSQKVHVEVMREVLRLANNMIVDGLAAHGEEAMTAEGREELLDAIRSINGARRELKG